MSVPKHLQNLSAMEYYKGAMEVRKEIVLWLMRDFGAHKNIKSLRMVLDDVTPEETATVNAVFEAHGKSLNKQFAFEYPEWFASFERERLIAYACDTVSNVVKANSIYPQCMAELDLRRRYQDSAIASCYALFNEIDFIKKFFNGDLNFLTNLLVAIQREVHLLKGWRQADNKFRLKFK